MKITSQALSVGVANTLDSTEDTVAMEDNKSMDVRNIQSTDSIGPGKPPNILELEHLEFWYSTYHASGPSD